LFYHLFKALQFLQRLPEWKKEAEEAESKIQKEFFQLCPVQSSLLGLGEEQIWEKVEHNLDLPDLSSIEETIIIEEI